MLAEDASAVFPSMKFLRDLSIRLLVTCLLPWVAWWVRRHEHLILITGRPLEPHEMNWAIKVGVHQVGRIRILRIPEIPMPAPHWIQRLGDRFSFACHAPAGMTLGHGIYVSDACADEPSLLIHEFVHVGQYERLGSLKSFLRQYLRECLTVGYESAPLEREARDRTSAILGT